jgi:hypothetical protein
VALYLQPVTLTEVKRFLATHHRHNPRMVGWKFGLAVNDGETVVGVAAVGRPLSRVIQAREAYTAEVIRVCTDGTPHAASKLYAACWRACRAMGYRRLITATLVSEPGTSLRAAGFKELYVIKGRSWDCPSRPRVDKHTIEDRMLWQITLDMAA